MAGAFLLLLTLVPIAPAAQINYGSHMGTHVTYVNVTEDTDGHPLPLFGPPTVTGNSIDFNPVGFEASSTGAASEQRVGNLQFMVTAKPGSRLDSITFSEAGDTTLTGNVTPGSMGTATAVFASGVLDIQEVDFMGINHISVPFSLTFSPSGGTYFLGTDGGGGPIFHTQFTGSATLPIDAILVANGYASADGATRISIDLNNSLSAVSQLGTTASIAKKDFGGIAIVTEVRNEVPEPASMGVIGLAVAGLALRRRR